MTFTPTASGTRTAAVTLTDNATGSPQTVSLTGTGTAPAASLSPTSLTFASQAVGATSAAQTVTLNNTGNAALSITSIALTGANASDFAQTNTCGSSRSGRSQLHDQRDLYAHRERNSHRSRHPHRQRHRQPAEREPHRHGHGARRRLSPTSLTFASQAVGATSAAQTITLNNTGNAALSITSLALTGTNPGDFAQTNNCGQA